MAFKTWNLETAGNATAAVPATAHPVLRVAAKEWLEMSRDARFRWAVSTVFTLLLVSLLLGASRYRQLRAEREAGQQAVRRQWLEQGRKNPHYAAHDGTFVFKPATPLSLVDPGVEPYTGAASFLEAHRQNEFQFRPARDNSAVQRFGELTAAGVLQLLLPLVIVLLSYGTLAGEREAGLLRQTLSVGVAPGHLGLGKLLGIGGALLLLLFPATLLGVLALTLTSARNTLGDGLARYLLLCGAYLLYFGTWTGLSLAVSARAATAQGALVTLLGTWVAVSFLVPRLAADVARWQYPTPVAIEFAERIHAEAKSRGGHSRSPEEEARRTARLLRQYGVKRAEDLPVNTMGLAMQEGEEFSSAVTDRHYSALWRTFRRQNAIYQAAAVAAPLLAVRSLSMGLAGTDWEQNRDFVRATEQYRRQLVKTMNEDLTYHSRTGQREYQAGPEAWARVPEFSYQAPRVGWVVQRQAGSLAVLCLWCAAAAAFAYHSLRKVQVQ